MQCYNCIASALCVRVSNRKFKSANLTFSSCLLQVRAIVDPILCLPVSNTGLYVVMDTLAGKEDKFEQVKTKFPTTYLSGCAFWIPAQIINFRFFPVHLRMVYVSTTCFVWSNMLCYIKNTDLKAGTKAKTE